MRDNNLEKLKKRLYKKEESFQERLQPPELSPRDQKVSLGWRKNEQKKEPSPIQNYLQKQSRKTYGKWLILCGGIIILILIAIIGFIYFLKGGGLVSSRNIEIEIQAPNTIKGGELATWQISITNHNDAALETADLVVDYPKGAQLIGSVLEWGALREREPLGRINPGETVQKTFKAFLFGEENADLTTYFTLEYRLEGSNAIFAKSQEHKVKILQAPVGISISAPKEINIGQVIELEVQYILNSAAPLKDLVFEMQYPPGFQYIEAEPQPFNSDNNRWKVGDLEPGKERDIIIRGTFKGQDLEEKNFRSVIGLLQPDNSIKVYGSGNATVLLKKSFLDIALDVNQGNKVVSAGDMVNVRILWKNNLPTEVRNAIIEMKLNGAAIDQQSIAVKNGFYKGSEQKVIWNASSFPALSLLQPGEEGEVQLQFSIHDPLPIHTNQDKNFKISIEARIFTERLPTDFSRVDISGYADEELKVASQLQLARRGLYYSGAFENTGPMPPRVGKKTTYTVVWSVVNSSNDLEEVKVKASLPPYIEWLNAVSPADEDVSYNKDTGELVWNIEQLPAGTGIIMPAKEVAFQIALVPGLDQVNTSPILVSEVVAEGYDAFANVILKHSKPAITTYLRDDPQFKYEDRKVVE